ncbi:hypothetical protein FSP39_014180 [Pinctada imbricata]|uniref:Uncharacterized protein n=1 Tax=Pinctada imbricata TaxID=66713 RepID=A0AA88Y787_PINIB|nr:hypothetical protein FSP39_014180 [Pinctada imbricata]
MQSTVGSFTLNTPFQPARFIQVAFSNQGTPTNFRSHGETTFNSRKYESDVIFTHSDKITSGSITSKSPVQGWEETVITFNRDGTSDNFKASGEIRYSDKKIEGSLTHEFKKDDVNTVATLSSPFTDIVVFKLNQNTRPKGFVTDTEFSVGNDNSWKSHTLYKFRRGNLKFESDVELIMTGEKNTFILDAEHKGHFTDFTSKASGSFNNEKASASLQYSGDKWENVNAAAKLELPVQDYEKLEFVLTNKKNGLTHKMDMDVQYATNKKISSKSSLTVNLPSVLGTLEVTTPIQGFSSMDMSMSHSESNVQYKSEMKVTVENEPLYQVTSTLDKRTYLGEISALRKDKKVFSMKYDEKKERRELTTMVTYNDTMTVTMGTGCQEPMAQIVVSASSSVNTKLPLNWNVKLATPYTEDFTATLQHSESGKEYSTEVDGQFGFSTINAKSIIGKDMVTVNTAITFSSPAMESFAFTFTNGNNGGEYVTEAEGTYGAKTMRLKSTNTINFPSIDSSTQFTSPFTEDLDITITNDKRRKAYITTAAGTYGDMVSKVTSNIEVNLPSLSAMVTVSNTHPHSDFSTIKISFKHDGEWEDMKTTVSVNTDKHDPILAETRFKYSGQTEVEASAKFTSGIRGAENLGFSLTNTKQSDAYIAHADVTMDSSRQIVWDSTYKFIQRSKDDMDSDIKVIISTPFQKFSSGKYMATYKKQGLNTRSSEYLEYNGKDYVDYSSIVNLDPAGEFYTISYDYRAPRPMEFVVNVRPSYLEGSANLNWNKLDCKQ